MPPFALIICFLEFGITLATGIRQIYNQIDKIVFPKKTESISPVLSHKRIRITGDFSTISNQ